MNSSIPFQIWQSENGFLISINKIDNDFLKFKHAYINGETLIIESNQGHKLCLDGITSTIMDKIVSTRKFILTEFDIDGPSTEHMVNIKFN